MGLCEGNLRMPLTELEPEHTEKAEESNDRIRSKNPVIQTERPGGKTNDSCDYAWL